MKNIYLIYGEEYFLIKEKIKAIINQYHSDNNLISKYDLTETPLSKVLEDAAMPSFFNPMKVIVCNQATFLTSNDKTQDDSDIKQLLRYLSNPIDSTILIISLIGKLDERKKIVKTLKKEAQVFQYQKLNQKDLMIKVKDIFTQAGYQINNDNIYYLLTRTGSDLTIINNECQKLMTYKIDTKKIESDDIKELVPKYLDDTIFNLIDAVINKDQSQIFTIYQQLLTKGEEPIKIIVLLANQIRLIYQVKTLIMEGYKEIDIATKLAVHPYRVKLAWEKSRNYSDQILIDYLNKLADLDIGIKTGQIDKNIGLEMFFLKL
jgi:DNA polymerase-3 subunit delta